MPPLSIRLFGPPQFNLNGHSFNQHLLAKSQALLAYLAIKSEAIHRRDTLAGLLWPDRSDKAALASLRQAISQLRSTIPQYLQITARTLQFLPENQPESDLAEFRHLVGITEKHAHVSRSNCASCIRNLEQAVELYQAPLLSHFLVKDAPEFEEWLALERQTCEQAVISALSDMAEFYLQQSLFPQAEKAALRQVELDPYREIAHQQVMRSLVQSGQRPMAIQHYESFCSLLKNDLGVNPEAETVALYEEICLDKHSLFDLAHPHLSSMPVGPGLAGGIRTGHAFVGRKNELALLQARFHEMLTGSGKIVLVAGDAGWGKTALIDAFTQQVRVSHPNTIVAFGNGIAYTGFGDPYLPFREILEFLTGNVETRWAAGTILPDQAYRMWKMMPLITQAIVEEGFDLIDTFVTGQSLLQRVTAVFDKEHAHHPKWLTRLRLLLEQKNAQHAAPTPVLQNNLFEQYTHILQKTAGQQPLILVMDDMQWMDPGSVSLLFHLGKHLLNHRILLIGAYRPTDLRLYTAAPDTEEIHMDKPGLTSVQQDIVRQRHPLEYVINEFKRQEGNIEMTLSQGDEGFIDALIDSEPNALDRSFRAAFQGRTRGHPLFAVELLQSMLASGGLVKDKSGRLVEGGTLNWDILPARVEAVIAERLGRLPKRLLDVLKIASVEGEVFTAEIVAQVLGIEEDEIIHLLSVEIGKEHHLARSEGVHWQTGKRLFQYRFDHILFQKYLYTTLDPIERVHWHEKTAFAMEKLFENNTSEVAVSLSWHFEKAENVNKAVFYLNLAGEKAMQVSANQEGMGHFTRAINLLGSLPDTPGRAKQELTLQINLAVSILAVQGYSDVGIEKAFSRAQNLCQQIGDTIQTFPILWQLACYRVVSQGDFITGGAMLQDLVDMGQQSGDPLLTALGHWGMGWYNFFIGDYLSSKSHLEVMINIYDPSRHHYLAYVYSQDPGATCQAILGFDQLALGFPDQAVKAGFAAIKLARQINHPYTLALTLAYVGLIFGFMGDIPNLLLFSEELLEVTQKYGFIYWSSAGLFSHGWAMSLSGQSELAIREISQAWEIVLSLKLKNLQEIFGLIMSEMLFQTGRADEGLKIINKTIDFVSQTGEFLVISELVRMRGEGLLALQPAQSVLAEAAFQESIRLAREKSALFFELKAALSLARLWMGQGKNGQAHSLLANLYSQFTEGFDLPDLQEAHKLMLLPSGN